MIKLALSAVELAIGEPITPLLEMATKHGVQWIELWYPGGFRAEGRDRTVSRIREAGVGVASVASGTSLVRDGSVHHHQTRLIEAIELAHDLGAGYANTYFGFRSWRDDDGSIELYAQNIRPCLRRAEELGVVITLENEFDGIGKDSTGSDITRRPEAVLRLMEVVDSPHLRLTFDACNFYFAGAEPFPQSYEMLRPYIAYVHAKDGRCTGEARSTDTGWTQFIDTGRHYATCPLGEGGVNWLGLLHRLVADGYQGFLTLEPHASPENRTAAWEHAIKTVGEWMPDSLTRCPSVL
ncbi:MAG: sugar phosphate isomerase/epimerase [Chloroflexota bacterium]|nr:MAG: sugar phosphate isomerase/epimerase [Chloroflexota bacterium]